jgi:hypothetical protein
LWNFVVTWSSVPHSRCSKEKQRKKGSRVKSEKETTSFLLFIGTRRKIKKYYSKHPVLWKNSLESESLAVNTEHYTPPSGDRMQS